MSEVVIDASALLAFIRDEPGGDAVIDLMPRAVMSAVNVTEVHVKLMQRGATEQHGWQIASSLPTPPIAFDTHQARIAGSLAQSTRQLGLSFGDRACLALAKVLKVPVYTADRAWAQLDVGIQIHLIR